MDIHVIVNAAEQISVIIGALLALDNIADGVFKAMGYKEGDTFCGQIAELLNRAQSKLPSGSVVQPTQPTQPITTGVTS